MRSTRTEKDQIFKIVCFAEFALVRLWSKRRYVVTQSDGYLAKLCLFFLSEILKLRLRRDFGYPRAVSKRMERKLHAPDK
jgi:hypothetical protein